MYDTILVPTDGSEHAVRAAEHAFAVARAVGAVVHVLAVVDNEDADGEGREAVEAVTTVARRTDEFRTTIRAGTAHEEILDYAAAEDADLLAMGTHGRTGIERYVAGSVTERVVRLASVPVLTVQATPRSRIAGRYDELLVPTDGSEHAEAAVEQAVGLARVFDARLHAVSVVDTNAIAASPEYTIPRDLLDHLEERAEAATAEVAARGRNAGVETVSSVEFGYPASEILDYADEHDIGLVAMGTAGRTGLGRYLVGSTTERVIRHADVPVLAVNTRERE